MCQACTSLQSSDPRPDYRILLTAPRSDMHYVGIIPKLNKPGCKHTAPHNNEEGHPPTMNDANEYSFVTFLF